MQTKKWTYVLLVVLGLLLLGVLIWQLFFAQTNLIEETQQIDQSNLMTNENGMGDGTTRIMGITETVGTSNATSSSLSELLLEPMTVAETQTGLTTAQLDTLKRNVFLNNSPISQYFYGGMTMTSLQNIVFDPSVDPGIFAQQITALRPIFMSRWFYPTAITVLKNGNNLIVKQTFAFEQTEQPHEGQVFYQMMPCTPEDLYTCKIAQIQVEYNPLESFPATDIVANDFELIPPENEDLFIPSNPRIDDALIGIKVYGVLADQWEAVFMELNNGFPLTVFIKNEILRQRAEGNILPSSTVLISDLQATNGGSSYSFKIIEQRNDGQTITKNYQIRCTENSCAKI